MSQHNEPYYQARLHWVIFILPCVIILVGLIGLGYSQYLRDPSVLLLAVGGILFVFNLLSYNTSYININRQKLTLKTGVLNRKIVDITYNKIESVDIRQPILGSLIGYGTLIITGTGGSRRYIAHLSQPLTCRRHIEQAVNQVS